MASRSMKSPAVSASLGPASGSTDDEGGFAREHVSVPSDGVPLDLCLTREWLVTDGLGGYASGSVPGPHTRRYHGLLVAPLAPPLGRHVLLSHLDELVSGVAGATPVSLSSHEFEDGTIHPRGLDHLRSFELIDGRPTWIWDIGSGGQIERQIWCDTSNPIADGSGHHASATHISWTLLGVPSATLQIRPLATSRDFHAEWRGNGDWHFEISPVRKSHTTPPYLDARSSQDHAVIDVRAHQHAPSWHLVATPPRGATWNWDSSSAGWWWNFLHREERARGFDHVEDLYCVGTLSTTMQEGQTLTVTATVAAIGAAPNAAPGAGRTVVTRRTAPPPRRVSMVASLTIEPPRASVAQVQADADSRFLEQLRRAANDFIVVRNFSDRHGSGANTGRTVIAGYHWFGDWGRDTMIALPGLTQLTGRVAEACEVLGAWARVVNRGMLPNRFPDSGAQLGEGDYNTVDATLWFIHAIDRIDTMAGGALVDSLWPVLTEIIECHMAGTRHGIGVDPADGLVRCSDGQLTWMDARVDGIDQTPRAGKPVEVNALWIHALSLMSQWADGRGDRQGADRYRVARTRASESFQSRFWCGLTTGGWHRVDGTAGYLLDVIDGPQGNDASLRPNQLIAAALPATPLTRTQRRQVTETVRAHLWTPRGVRTLTPADPRYRGECSGTAETRDSAYHRGTAWAWLLGPMVDAWMLSHETGARALLSPLREHLWDDAGVGTISEIFDGDAPHTARGSIAQAWSVAEVGRAWIASTPLA